MTNTGQAGNRFNPQPESTLGSDPFSGACAGVLWPRRHLQLSYKSKGLRRYVKRIKQDEPRWLLPKTKDIFLKLFIHLEFVFVSPFFNKEIISHVVKY